MKKQSAGILLYRRTNKTLEVMLVHPGGPFWAKKDKAAWSIPKGEFEEGEDPLTAAKREFAEEVGKPAPDGDFLVLGEAKQSSGKIVHVWALEADFDPADIKSNLFKMEWPPKSGQEQEFPEIDKAAWFSISVAQNKIVNGQRPFLKALAIHLNQSLSDAWPEDKSAEQTALF